MAQKKMILDLDTGVDDALALAYAIADPAVDLIGIISSYGNVLVEQSAENSLKLLDLLGANDVPVFIGESHSSDTDGFEVMPISAMIHGDNGIGNVEVPASSRKPEAQSGVDFLIEAAHKYNDDLILIPTGPMTNLDAAIAKDPEVADLIGNITFMGGALTVPGNVTPFTEANINQDVLAADRVFKSHAKSTMVGLDVTMRTLLTTKETQEWRDFGTEKGRLYADIVDYYIDAYAKLGNPGGCALHDPLAVGVAINPAFVKTIDLNMTVTHAKESETQNEDGSTSEDWGRTIGDMARLNDKETNMKAAIAVNAEGYLAYFMRLLNGLLSK